MTRKIHIRITIGDKIFDLINMIFLTFCLLLYSCHFEYSKPIIQRSSKRPGGKGYLSARKAHISELRKDNKQLGYYQRFRQLGTHIRTRYAFKCFTDYYGSIPVSKKYACRKKRDHVVLRIHNAVQRRFDPTYLVVRSLGMIDKYAALIIPNALSVWNIVIARTFFINTIPTNFTKPRQ